MAFCNVYSADVAPLASSALFEKALTRVSDERREKVSRMRPPEGKRLSLGAGLLLSRALEDQGLDIRSLRIAAEKNGKPFLSDYPQIRFNLSHAGTRVLCVVSSCLCGCDVEQTDRGSEKIVRRFYAPEEQEILKAPPEDFPLLFTRIWTRKESYLKATGEGLFRPPESFSVFSLPPLVHFQEDSSVPGYLSTICLLSPEEPPAPRWQEIQLA